jgi:hypothetical protein
MFSSGLVLAFVSVNTLWTFINCHQLSNHRCHTLFLQRTSSGVNYFFCKEFFWFSLRDMIGFMNDVQNFKVRKSRPIKDDLRL